MVAIHSFLRLAVLAFAPILVFSKPVDNAEVEKTKCAGQEYTYHGLAGYGTLPSNFTDKFGDTVSTGSAIAISGWKSKNQGKSYKATLWGLPDRGWNTEGTSAYQPRIHKFSITFTPATSYPSGNNLIYKYEDTILFTDPNGNPLSGLDPTTTLKYKGFPNLPAGKFTGDGFGGKGAGGTRASLDPEGLVLDEASGGFWISDEYGPFIYHFTKSGRMDTAVRPPDALIPIRKGKENFSSNNPPIFNKDQEPDPVNPESGRSNNQGLEGLTYSKKENALYAILQSGAINDGGLEKTTNRYTRLLKYKLDKEGKNPKLAGEWAVPLPMYEDPTKEKSNNPRAAATSEILSLENGNFLILSRDSGFGRGMPETKSVYRQIDVFSIDKATDFEGKYDDFEDSFAPDGKLKKSVTPAKYCSFLDININSQLSKFGLLNGGDDNDAEGLLNEKWEGLALVPVDGEKKEYYLFASGDNDFITQDGHQNFGKDVYKDGGGFDLLSQTLVFKISIK